MFIIWFLYKISQTLKRKIFTRLASRRFIILQKNRMICVTSPLGGNTLHHVLCWLADRRNVWVFCLPFIRNLQTTKFGNFINLHRILKFSNKKYEYMIRLNMLERSL